MPRAVAATILLRPNASPRDFLCVEGELPIGQAMKPDNAGRPSAEHSIGRSEAAVATVRVVDSKTLFGGRREVQIRHNGAVYTLRETRQGKLILNK